MSKLILSIIMQIYYGLVLSSYLHFSNMLFLSLFHGLVFANECSRLRTLGTKLLLCFGVMFHFMF
jgi:hypothetical protein